MLKKKRTAFETKNSKILELLDDSYVGVIEDIDDPNYEGRCKVRVFGVFGDKGDSLAKIPKEDLPWAYPLHDLQFASKSGSGKFSTPRLGARVRVIFENDHYHPRYINLEKLDDELKSFLKDNYENFSSLFWDTDEQVKIYYTKKSGLMIDYKQSIVNIDPNGAIIINHKDSSSTIELRGNDIDINTKNAVNISTPNNISLNSNNIAVNGATVDIGGSPIYSNINGEILMKLLLAMATATDAKTPQSPGSLANVVKQMEPLILSKTVKTSG